MESSRGRKVYRRFAGEDDEEEEIDEEDADVFNRAATDGARRTRMKTLTRKSVKPTRLFQTDEQKAARQREKEEETTTDVEEEDDRSSTDPQAAEPSTNSSKPAATQADDKKTSPFDQWGRARKSQDGSTARPGKRSATDAFEQGSPVAEGRSTIKRKTRA
jgi:hypothetical protein